MRVAIRVDSSPVIGTGHVMRCLTLAEYCRERGDEVVFISRDHPGNISGLVEQRGFKLLRLPYSAELGSDSSTDEYASWLGVSWESDAKQSQAAIANLATRVDWLVVDHYALDRKWQNQLRSVADRIMVIDDLANRSHECDLLLDQNLFDEPEERYGHLVGERCRFLLGPQHSLLRPEFIEARQDLRVRSGVVDTVLVFFGGADPTNETAKALEALIALGDRQPVADIVVGSICPHQDELMDTCHGHANLRIHVDSTNMAELMANADLAIGGGGTSTWERCYLGLPCLTVTIADNQREMTEAVAGRKAAWNLGWRESVTSEEIKQRLLHLLGSPEEVRTVGENAQSIMRGYNNGCPSVVKLMMEKACAELR